MKYKAPRMAAIFFMTSFNRDGGAPLAPPPLDPQLHGLVNFQVAKVTNCPVVVGKTLVVQLFLFWGHKLHNCRKIDFVKKNKNITAVEMVEFKN